MTFKIENCDDPGMVVKLLNLWAKRLEFPPIFKARGPCTVSHRSRKGPASGIAWSPLPLMGGESYRYSVAVEDMGVKIRMIPLKGELAANQSLASMSFDDAMVLLDGFEDFVEAASEHAERGALEQIERDKRRAMFEAHEAAKQRAREQSTQAAEVYGQEWGAF
jgi:hypothetical protein